MHASRRQRLAGLARVLLPIALVTAVVFALHRPILPIGADHPEGVLIWDAVDFSYPFLAYANRCFHAGIFPQWNPFSFAGTPFLGNLQTAMLNPPSLVATLFSELTMLRYQLLFGAQLWLGALGMYWWGRARTGSAVAGLVGAIVFSGCGTVCNFYSHYILMALFCALPFPFAAFEAWERTRRVRWLLVGSAGIFTWLVTSYPSMAGYFCVAFALFWSVRRVRTVVVARDWRLVAVEVVAFGAIPLCLAAIHLVPAKELLPQLLRGHGLPLVATYKGSILPESLASALMPGIALHVSSGPNDTLRDFGLGMTAVCLAALALARPTSGRGLLLVAGVVCADLMCGEQSQLMPTLHAWSFLSANSYYPVVEFGALFTFVMLTLAIEGASDLVHGRAALWRCLVALGIVAAVWLRFHHTWASAYEPWRSDKPHDWYLYTIDEPLTAVGLVVATVALSRVRRLRVAVLALGLMAGGYFDARNDIEATQKTMYFPATPRWFAQQDAQYRAAERRYFEPIRRFPRWAMYPRIINANLVDGKLADWGYDSSILALQDSAIHNRDVRAVLLDPEPAFVADRVRVTPAAASVPLLQGGERVAALVRSPGADVTDAPPGRAHARVRVESYAPNRIAYLIATERPQLIVFNELAIPGWQLRVDGRPQPLYTANGYFRAARAEPGEHRYELRYRAPGLVVGFVLFVLGLALALALPFVWRRWRPAQYKPTIPRTDENSFAES